MQSDIRWLSFEQVAALHDLSIEKYGGAAGVKDESAVHSAINAPQDRNYYTGEDNLLTLAVILCERIAGNHGFSDGNKRTALASMRMFLQLNYLDISEDLNGPSGFKDEDGREWTLLEKAVKDLTAHEIDADAFQEFLEDHIVEIKEAEEGIEVEPTAGKIVDFRSII